MHVLTQPLSLRVHAPQVTLRPMVPKSQEPLSGGTAEVAAFRFPLGCMDPLAATGLLLNSERKAVEARKCLKRLQVTPVCGS